MQGRRCGYRYPIPYVYAQLPFPRIRKPSNALRERVVRSKHASRRTTTHLRDLERQRSANPRLRYGVQTQQQIKTYTVHAISSTVTGPGRTVRTNTSPNPRKIRGRNDLLTPAHTSDLFACLIQQRVYPHSAPYGPGRFSWNDSLTGRGGICVQSCSDGSGPHYTVS